MDSVSIVGLGAMGSRFALRLLDTGHDVVVWNRSQQRLEPLLRRGARAASSPPMPGRLTSSSSAAITASTTVSCARQRGQSMRARTVCHRARPVRSDRRRPRPRHGSDPRRDRDRDWRDGGHHRQAGTTHVRARPRPARRLLTRRGGRR
ncbi:MAG: NAD(P)-binding domain-containing protein [Actinobacteria bacterium]|nr:NAD(P)-binding domain-containing protein [Actinomycetota bacterium]